MNAAARLAERVQVRGGMWAMSKPAFVRLLARYAPVFRAYPTKWVFVWRDAHVRRVLEHDRAFGVVYRPHMRALDAPFFLGLANSPDHRAQRQTATDALAGRVDAIGDLTARHTAALLADRVDVIEDVIDPVIAISMERVLGIHRMTADELDDVRAFFHYVFIGRFSTSVNARAHAGTRRLEHRLDAVIHARRLAPDPGNDALGRMLDLRDGEIRDQLVGLIGAWVANVSRFAALAVDALIERPADVLHADANGTLEEWVLEALRTHTPTPVLVRECERELVVGHRRNPPRRARRGVPGDRDGRRARAAHRRPDVRPRHTPLRRRVARAAPGRRDRACPRAPRAHAPRRSAALGALLPGPPRRGVRARMIECDLVLKGGATSAVIYLGSIEELARSHRFRSIGGTSSGAIAGALAAAAEYRRQSGKGDFTEALAGVRADLTRNGFQAGMFQADPSMQPVLDLLVAITGKRRVLARPSRPGPCIVACGCAGAARDGRTDRAGGTVGAAEWILAVMLATLATGLAVMVAGALLGLRVRRHLDRPVNGFGVSVGRTQPGAASEGVTDWLNKSLQAVAGRPAGQPLTFADLREHGIDLQVMTTDLSLGMPVAWPGDPRAADLRFREGEWRGLFPPAVLERVIGDSDPDTDGLRPLVLEELPVLVAVRMSIALPILIAAVPVYDRDGARHWLSDGGACSNFPMHLFDVWAPERPTFGLDVAPWPAATRSNLCDWAALRPGHAGPRSAMPRRPCARSPTLP